MQVYPHFLNEGPRFFGLSLFDLGLFSLTMYFGMFLELNPFIGLLVSAGLVLFINLLRGKVDFVGHLNSSNKNRLLWNEYFEEGHL